MASFFARKLHKTPPYFTWIDVKRVVGIGFLTYNGALLVLVISLSPIYNKPGVTNVLESNISNLASASSRPWRRIYRSS